MAAIPVFSTDRIVFTYTSLTIGNQGSVPTNSPQWFFPWQAQLAARYGTKRPCIFNSGISGDTIGDLTTNFTGRIGIYAPNILIIDGCPNDIGVVQATLDAFWTKATSPAQYRSLQVPRAVIFISTNWRGSEATGGTNQAQIQTDNTLIKARTNANNGAFPSGTAFMDVWTAWNAVRSVFNPGNLASGVWTNDGTHQTPFGAQFYVQQLTPLLSLQ